MNRLFDIKEKLTDAEYKGFCDDIADQYKEKNKIIGYCELKFTRQMIQREIEDDIPIFSYYTKIQTLVVKMDTTVDFDSLHATIIRRIAEEGSFPLCIHSLKDIVGTTSKAEAIWDEYCGHYLFIDTKEHQREDEDGDENSTIESTSITLRRATGCALISFKLL